MANHADGVYTRAGRKGFYIQWRDAYGRRHIRKTNAKTLASARRARAAEVFRVEQARLMGFTPPSRDSFAELCERFLQYQKARLTEHAYLREEGIVSKHLRTTFTGAVADIRRMHIQRYITLRCDKVSAGTVVKEFNTLKHMLRLAVEWEIIPTNPAYGVRPPKPSAGRVRYLQPTEVRRVIEACPLWLRPIATMAVTTGMRRSEILNLRWIDVDLEHGRVFLPQTKNGDGRVVYLNQTAIAVLQIQGEKLFAGCSPEQVSVAFRRACDRIGVKDFHFHDLRHTAASWLRMGGADIHTVAQLLGHRDLRMAARYQHLSPAFLYDAVSRLDAVFGDLRFQGASNTEPPNAPAMLTP